MKGMKNMQNGKKENRIKEYIQKNQLHIKILILIILMLLLVITSFNTGRKFYLLKNTFFDSSKGEVNSSVARWYFNAKITNRK